MRVSLRIKQVVGVTALVGLSMAILSAFHLSSLARVGLEESRGRGELLARTIYQRAREAVGAAADPYTALRLDPGVRSLLESSIAYGQSVTSAAIVDTRGIAIAHSFPGLEGRPVERHEELAAVLERSAWQQLRAIYGDQTLDVEEPIDLSGAPFGAIRIGLSPVLIRDELRSAVRPMVWSSLLLLGMAMLAALVFAQWILRPIHVISSGLTRLGRGEVDVTLDLPPEDAFRDVGQSFKAISAQLAERPQPGGLAHIESVVERLEDAVAVVDGDGALLFANAAMRATLPPSASPRCFVDGSLAEQHAYRQLVGDALSTHESQGPVSAAVAPNPADESDTGERLITAHAIEDLDHRFVGVMLVARNLAYLSQVQSTVEYSHKLASLGRLMAGVAHEVKNPLNAMTIHLELVRQKLATASAAAGARAPDRLTAMPAGAGSVLGIAHGPAAESPGSTETSTRVLDTPPEDEESDAQAEIRNAREHVDVIGDEIRRLDEVIQGFLRFIRPEELKPQPVAVGDLVREVFSLVEPEAHRLGITTRFECPASLPDVRADAALLRQALLNLALNACQAMSDGGTLAIRGRVGASNRVLVDVEDTGVGIPPEQLERIFDLYYTTKPGGSGIGLSMVYRIVQLHGGEIEVQSVPGRGTRFELSLPRA